MRWFTKLGVALGLVALAAVAPATAASAGPRHTETDVSITAYSDCPSGWFCVWSGTGGQGTMARFQIGTPDLGDFGLDNRVSSLWNRTGALWCTYLNTNYSGDPWSVGNWQGNTSQYGRDNNISSLRRGAC
ncbi:peptidase inhibitor family I36 protein [Amycolatopsis sp. 195334CR]|uniref:peptidase inhibitor family I36 protein n=1 Tax=Amycolatopsis sp. 195334CR TaxID=2814588 RepID=UPI001A908840|nr:peptidase inhibitor family I36 protein [Amycolatopsis sp. 195334CR]MBN6040008.1 peptidase inhibitor family I36 protein [Amycolatopsis sp. 195334CR]